MADLRPFDPLAFPPVMNRKQAATYLTGRLGYHVAAKTLANRVVTGGGPRFKRRRWNLVTYDRVDLEAWAAAQVVTVQPAPASSRIVPDNPA